MAQLAAAPQRAEHALLPVERSVSPHDLFDWWIDRYGRTLDAFWPVADTPIGRLPTPDALDTNGLRINDDDLATLLSVDVEGWRAAIPQIREHYAQFGADLPASLTVALDTLDERLS